MDKVQRENNIPVTLICYILFFSFGIYTALLATQLPIYLEEFNLKISDGGVFNAVSSIGCLLGMFISGILLPRYNKKNLVIISYLIFGLMLILAGFSTGYVFLLILMFLIGVSSRFFDAACNAFIPVIARKNTGFYLNLLHTSHSAGCLVGPLLMTFLLTNGMPWRETYIFLGIGFVIILILFYFVQYITIPKNSNVPAAKTIVETIPYKQLFVPKIIMLVVLLFIYCGHLGGIGLWYFTYMDLEMGQTESFSSIALSIYWLGAMISRIICAILSTKIREETIIKIAGIFGAIFLAIGIFSGNSMIMLIFVGISAVFTGCYIPVVVSCGFNEFPEATGRISVIMFSTVSIGTIFLPYAMGIIGDSFGLHTGMIINVICVIIVGVLSLGLRKGNSK